MRRFLRTSRRWLQWVLAALTETAVVTPWMLLLYASWGGEAWTAALPGAWLMLLVFLGACLWESTPWARRRPALRAGALLAATLAGYLAAYAHLPAGFQSGLLTYNRALAFVPVSAYLWYRGASTRIAGLEYGPAISRFPLQFAAQFTGMLVLTVAHRAAYPEVQLLLYWSVFLLFGAGLSLLVLLRARGLEEGTATPAATLAVLGLALMTIVASLILSVDGLAAGIGAVVGWLSPAASWLFQVVMLIAVRWAQLIEMVVRFTVKPLAEYRAKEGLIQWGELDDTRVPETWTGRWVGFDPMPYVGAALVILFVLGLGLLLTHLSRMKESDGPESEERTSLGFWHSLWADLLSLVEPLRRKAQARAGVGASAGEPDPGAARRVYREFQRWGAAQGRARRSGETPNRYQRALAALWPRVEEPAAKITAMYNEARYGPAPPADEAVEAAREALARLREEEPS